MTATPLSRRCSGRDLCLSFCFLLPDCPAWPRPHRVWSWCEHACTLSICILYCELCENWMNLMDGLVRISFNDLEGPEEGKPISKYNFWSECTCLNVTIISLIISCQAVWKETLFDSCNSSGLGLKGGFPLVNSKRFWSGVSCLVAFLPKSRCLLPTAFQFFLWFFVKNCRNYPIWQRRTLVVTPKAMRVCLPICTIFLGSPEVVGRAFNSGLTPTRWETPCLLTLKQLCKWNL